MAAITAAIIMGAVITVAITMAVTTMGGITGVGTMEVIIMAAGTMAAAGTEPAGTAVGYTVTVAAARANGFPVLMAGIGPGAAGKRDPDFSTKKTRVRRVGGPRAKAEAHGRGRSRIHSGRMRGMLQ